MSWILAIVLFGGAANSVTGSVRDSSGAAVPNAVVIVRPVSGASGPDRQGVTGPDGRFAVETPADGDITLVVRAGGFAEQTQRVPSASRNGEIQVVLEPARLLETVTVTASRSEQRVMDVPASVNVITSEEIRQSPAVVADDVLRQVPTFTRYRRTSSLS
jgi:outer membrane receptor for ferrienterochelin and colicins